VSGGRAIRWSTVGAVAVVALVAAFVSWRHALAVVEAHGEAGPVARVYPLTIDGLIYAASMVLLDCARRLVRSPLLAYAALGIGIGATLAANIAAGLASGPVGAVVAAWPAPALVISYELLMYLVRSAAPAAPGPLPVPPAELNGHGTVALETLAGDLAAGRVPSIRAIRSGLQVGQDKASQVQAYLRTRV
jgi:Protein of unknown function (DUF2637)